MLDESLTEAIAEVVAEAGHPPSVAQRLVAWLNEMSKAELGKDANTQFLNNVCSALKLEKLDEN